MRGVIRWFRTPLPVKFWLLAAAAFVVVLLEISAVLRVAEVWSWPYPRPWESEKALWFGGYMAVLFALGALLIWRAIRAYPRSTDRS